MGGQKMSEQAKISPDFSARFLAEKRRTGGSTVDECFNCLGDPDVCGCYPNPIISEAYKACEAFYDPTTSAGKAKSAKAGDLYLSPCLDDSGQKCFGIWGIDDEGNLIKQPLSAGDHEVAKKCLTKFLAKNSFGKP